MSHHAITNGYKAVLTSSLGKDLDEFSEYLELHVQLSRNLGISLVICDVLTYLGSRRFCHGNFCIFAFTPTHLSFNTRQFLLRSSLLVLPAKS